MTKLKILKIINFIIIGILCGILALLYFKSRSIFDLYWYVIAILFYALMLLCKYFIFGSDSVLWFGLCLLLFGGYMIYYNRGIIGVNSFPILVIIPAIVSLFIFGIYKNILHLNLFVMCMFIGMPMFLISLKIVFFWIFVIVEIVSVLSGALLMNFIYHNYKR